MISISTDYDSILSYVFMSKNSFALPLELDTVFYLNQMIIRAIPNGFYAGFLKGANSKCTAKLTMQRLWPDQKNTGR